VPANLGKILKLLNVRMLNLELPDSVSGFTVINPYNNSPAYCLVINTNKNYSHRRFTIAHEIWHMLSNETELCMNRDIFKPKHESERMANIFATELLMPESSVRECYKKGWRRVSDYCKFFKVSKRAMIIRLFYELKLPRKGFVN